MNISDKRVTTSQPPLLHSKAYKELHKLLYLIYTLVPKFHFSPLTKCCSGFCTDNLVIGKELPASPGATVISNTGYENSVAAKTGGSACTVPEELFVPGSVYYLKRNLGSHCGSSGEFFTLWKRHPGEHFQRIVLSSNLISDHKCDSHYYALRDVLKGLPGVPSDDSIFR